MSASGILLRSISVFLSPSLPLFLILSVLLLSFRSAVHLGSLTLSSALDRDPHIHSLLSRLYASSSSSSNDDDLQRLYSEEDHTFSSSSLSSYRNNNSKKKSSNISHFLLLPKPTVVTLRIPDPPSAVLTTFPTQSPRRHLDRRDLLSLLYIACLFSAAHLYSLFGFLLSYSLALAVVSLASAAPLLHRPPSLLRHLRAGTRLGLRRLPLLLFLRWSLRDALVQFLSVALLRADHLSLLKLFLRVKLLPFFLTALPPTAAPPSFPLLLALLEFPVSAVFALNFWVALMDRRTGRELLREGCFLASTVARQVCLVRLLETVVCGDLGMHLVSHLFGAQFLFPTMVMQSIAEVYFMVVWFVLYLSARSAAGDADGRRFGFRELENLYDTLSEGRSSSTS